MKDQSIVKEKIKLKQVDPDYSGKLEKGETKVLTDQLGRRLDKLQQLLYANSRQAVLLIFQGLDASGKDGSIRSLFHHVNPAGVETANFKVPTDVEQAHDFLWRVHTAVPRYGYIGVFNRSHYEAVLAERVLKIVPRKIWSRRYEQIVAFERMLAENHVLILKFHLHISRKEQARRFEERLTNPRKNWKFSEADLKTRDHWNDYIAAYEDMLNTTSHAAARWHVVPADHNWYRDYIVAKTVVRAMDALRMKWPKPVTDLSKVRIK